MGGEEGENLSRLHLLGEERWTARKPVAKVGMNGHKAVLMCTVISGLDVRSIKMYDGVQLLHAR